jgi:hypothetical protein
MLPAGSVPGALALGTGAAGVSRAGTVSCRWAARLSGQAAAERARDDLTKLRREMGALIRKAYQAQA